MPEDTKSSDMLVATYELILREVGGYPIDGMRLRDALPLLQEIIGEIRRLDEIDIDQVEPATTFRVR